MKKLVWGIVLIGLCLPTTVQAQSTTEQQRCLASTAVRLFPCEATNHSVNNSPHSATASVPNADNALALSNVDNSTSTLLSPASTAVLLSDTYLSLHTADSLRPSTATVPALHSPSKALYLSLLPGAGQVYNHQAWKIPIIYALLGGLGYWSYNSYGNMSRFRDEYLHRVNGGAPKLEGYTSYPDASIYNLYVSNNQYFQLGIVLCVAVYGLNLLDAYVYGHLFDFQIDNNISLAISPTLSPAPASAVPLLPALDLSFRF